MNEERKRDVLVYLQRIIRAVKEAYRQLGKAQDAIVGLQDIPEESEDDDGAPVGLRSCEGPDIAKVPRGDGIYATKDGRIWTRTVARKKEEMLPDNQVRELNQTEKKGVAYVDIYHGPKKYAYRVAVLMLLAFHTEGRSPQCDGMVPEYVDGDKTNLHADNLAWGFRSRKHSKSRLSDDAPQVGESNGNAKLTKEEVIDIHGLHKAGYPVADIAECFPQVAEVQIARILNGERWRREYEVLHRGDGN